MLTGNDALVPGMTLYNVIDIDVGTVTEPAGSLSFSTNASHCQELDEKSAAAEESMDNDS